GAAGAIQAEIGGEAVGVEVVHRDHLGIGGSPAEDEEAVGSERDTAPAPGADALRRRRGVRGVRLGEGKKVVAPAGELEELRHGSATRTSPPGALSFPVWSMAVTR